MNDSSPDALKMPRPVLVIDTEWKAFKGPGFSMVKARLKQPVIFDGCNLFELANIKALGIEYYGIVRGN
jgi:UDPglucose 6-dehydrogenase